MYRVLLLVLLALLILGVLFYFIRPNSTAGPEAQTIDVVIEDGAMSPAELAVREGDPVTLQMASEEPVEIHVHGYNFEEEIEPDQPATLSFEASTTGRFEIEDHETGEGLGTLVVEPR